MIKASTSGVLNNRALDEEIARLEAMLDDLRRLRRGEHPSLAELSTMPSIDQWIVESRKEPCLVGLVQGHPELPHLRLSMTSTLEVINVSLGYARTRSRFYSLGLRQGETSEGAKQ